jgi:hypothetical protein
VAFAVLQIALAVAAERSHWVRDPGYGDKEVFLRRLENTSPGAPVVVMLGTSRTGNAFHGRKIEEALGRLAVAFNFGIPASGPITHLLYLRRLLADGHRPDLLLVEVLPPSLCDLDDGPLESRALCGERLRRAEVEPAIGYGLPAGPTRERWRNSVLLPWYVLRFPVVGRAAPTALPWNLRHDWSRTTDDHGWCTPAVDAVTPEQYAGGLAHAADEYRNILNDLRPGGGAGRALGDLLGLCRANGIPVRLVLLPEGTGFRAFYPRWAEDRLYAYLRGVCAEHGCGLTDARAWMPDAAFGDGHHMLRHGAEAFSERLAREVIGPNLSPAR